VRGNAESKISFRSLSYRLCENLQHSQYTNVQLRTGAEFCFDFRSMPLRPTPTATSTDIPAFIEARRVTCFPV
jgi:hypothetical protein